MCSVFFTRQLCNEEKVHGFKSTYRKIRQFPHSFRFQFSQIIAWKLDGYPNSMGNDDDNDDDDYNDDGSNSNDNNNFNNKGRNNPEALLLNKIKY